MDIGKILNRLDQRLKAVERSPRLQHASIENTALQVYDGGGSLRAILGVQADGTTAANIVNGGPPPIPSTPTVASALGGVAVGWDGTFTGGAAVPLDWARVEVHTSTTAGFTPSTATLRATIETPQGGIAYIPATAATYACLIARNTSGAGSAATTVVGPYSPRPVAGDIGIGEITSTMISDGSVTTPKLYANAVTTAKLDVGSVDATALAATAITGKTITGGTITGSLFQTATSGQRITLNEANANKVLVYNSAGTAIGELSAQGLLVQGTNGATLWLDPNNAFPNLRLTNDNQTNSAVINVSGNAAVLGMNSGTFTWSGYTDMKWRTLFGIEGTTEFWAAERVRDATGQASGGRILLDANIAWLGYSDFTGTHPENYFKVDSTSASLSNGCLTINTPASSSSPGIYVSAGAGHTGNLLRLYNAANKFVVDKDGNTSIAGTLASADSDHGTVNAVMSSASSVDVTVTFNKTFPTAPHVVACLVGNPTLPSGSSALIVRPLSVTTTGCTIRVNDVGGTARTLTHRVDWIARS